MLLSVNWSRAECMTIKIQCKFIFIFFNFTMFNIQKYTDYIIHLIIYTNHSFVGRIIFQEWGLLKLCSLISLLGKFSISQQRMLESSNHIDIWQMSPQLSCSDICQIWTRYSIGNRYFDNWNKSTLGCVIPLGRPRSVYKSYVESRFLDSWFEMAKWPQRSRLMTPVFNTSQENLKKMGIWHKLGDSSSNPLQFIVQTSQIS